MTTTYKILFSKLQDRSVSDDLVFAIENRIGRSRILRLRIQTGIYIAGTLIAVLVFIPLTQYTASTMTQSGFSSYLSLIMSDGGLIFSVWKDFGIVIIESLPVMSIVGVLGLLLLSGYSLSKSLAYIRTLKTYHHA